MPQTVEKKPRHWSEKLRLWNLIATLGIVVLFVALLVYGLAAQSLNSNIDDSLRDSKPGKPPGLELPVLQPGELPPALAGKLNGAFADGRLQLSELRGTPVVLNFWASWCPPCREETPRLERAWRRGVADGVLVLGLNMQDVTDDARGFIRDSDISYPNIRDKSNGVAIEWGVQALPETYFLSAGGEVVGHVIGSVSDKQLEAGIGAAKSAKVLGSRDGGDSRPTR